MKLCRTYGAQYLGVQHITGAHAPRLYYVVLTALIVSPLLPILNTLPFRGFSPLGDNFYIIAYIYSTTTLLFSSLSTRPVMSDIAFKSCFMLSYLSSSPVK